MLRLLRLVPLWAPLLAGCTAAGGFIGANRDTETVRIRSIAPGQAESLRGGTVIYATPIGGERRKGIFRGVSDSAGTGFLRMDSEGDSRTLRLDSLAELAAEEHGHANLRRGLAIGAAIDAGVVALGALAAYLVLSHLEPDYWEGKGNMPAYIALIRGINVGGKSMPMAGLRDLFAKLGYADARTYIQSGNVVFTAPGKDGRKIAGAMEAAIAKTFGYEAAVLIRSLEEWRGMLKANPYAKRKLAGGERLFITFLEEPPAKTAAAALEAIPDPKDEIKVKGSEAFLLVRGSYGESNLSNAFVEKKLGVRATTRNMPTALKLLEMAEDGPA